MNDASVSPRLLGVSCEVSLACRVNSLRERQLPRRVAAGATLTLGESAVDAAAQRVRRR